MSVSRFVRIRCALRIRAGCWEFGMVDTEHTHRKSGKQIENIRNHEMHEAYEVMSEVQAIVSNTILIVSRSGRNMP